MVVDSEVDLALIRSEALYCLRKEQLVNLCKRRGINPRGKTNQLIDALRESIEAGVYKQPIVNGEMADTSQSLRLDPFKSQGLSESSNSNISPASPPKQLLSSKPSYEALDTNLASPSISGTPAQFSSHSDHPEPGESKAEGKSTTGQSNEIGFMPSNKHSDAIFQGSDSGEAVKSEPVAAEKQQQHSESSTKGSVTDGQATPRTEEKIIQSVPHDHNNPSESKMPSETRVKCSDKLATSGTVNAPGSPLRRKLSQLQKPLSQRVTVKRDTSQIGPVSDSVMNKARSEQAPEVPPKPVQHRVVMFSNNKKQEKVAMDSIPDPLSYASKQSALESTAKQSLFPELRHDTMYFMPEHRQAEKPLTHGDVRRIYAELLAERDAQREKKLPTRLGNIVRKIKGLKGAPPTARTGSHTESGPSSGYLNGSTQGRDAHRESLDIADNEMLRVVMDGCDAKSPQLEEPLPVLNVGEYGKAVEFSMPVPNPARVSEAEVSALAMTTPSISSSLNCIAAGHAENRQSAESSPGVPVKQMKRKLDPSSEEVVEKPRRRKRCTAVAVDVTNLSQAFAKDEKLGSTRSPASICKESSTQPHQDLISNSSRHPKSLRTTTGFRTLQENGTPKKSVRFSAVEQPSNTYRKAGLPRRQLRADALR